VLCRILADDLALKLGKLPQSRHERSPRE
jgi:hypothetical protein